MQQFQILLNTLRGVRSIINGMAGAYEELVG